ncbi:unnamed protein product [Aphanomyces euteiches]
MTTEDISHAPVYEAIDKNDYLFKHRMIDITDLDFYRCGNDCMNRITYMECYQAWNRKLGRSCGNRSLQTLEAPETLVFQTVNRGHGLKSVVFIPKGSTIVEYIGEVINQAMKIDRLAEQAKANEANCYMVELAEGVFIDSRRKGNKSRFINHSCMPNCEMVKVDVGPVARLAIVAKEDIVEGTELTYDYQVITNDIEGFECKCGSIQCRGFMTWNSRRGSQRQLWDDDDVELELEGLLSELENPCVRFPPNSTNAKCADEDEELVDMSLSTNDNTMAKQLPHVCYNMGSFEDVQVKFGLFCGTAPTNGHCLFVAMDACIHDIRHVGVGFKGNLLDEAAGDRIMAQRAELWCSVVSNQDAHWYASQEFVTNLVEKKKLNVVDAVDELFSQRAKYHPRTTLPKHLWGHSSDVFCFRKIVDRDIYVFSEDPKRLAWCLSVYLQRTAKKSQKLKYVNDQVPVEQWQSLFKAMPDAYFLVNKANCHWEPVFRKTQDVISVYLLLKSESRKSSSRSNCVGVDARFVFCKSLLHTDLV